MKEGFDSTGIEIEFKVWQRVLWRDKERQRERGKAQRKTAREWFGPYTIEFVKNRLLVKLMDVEKLVRMSRLKLYKERSKKSATPHGRAKTAIGHGNQKVLERGMRVGILWGGEDKIFKGTLGRFDKRRGMWKVHYDD